MFGYLSRSVRKQCLGFGSKAAELGIRSSPIRQALLTQFGYAWRSTTGGKQQWSAYTRGSRSLAATAYSKAAKPLFALVSPE